MNEKFYRDVYEVLVKFTGAVDSHNALDCFVQLHLDDEGSCCREYRFQGTLGYGGKYRAGTNRVDYYHEDGTPERQEIVDITNKELYNLLDLSETIDIPVVIGNAGKMRKKYPELREGQSYFNALHALHSKVASYIVGTDIDPFHTDSNIDNFMVYMIDVNTMVRWR